MVEFHRNTGEDDSTLYIGRKKSKKLFSYIVRSTEIMSLLIAHGRRNNEIEATGFDEQTKKFDSVICGVKCLDNNGLLCVNESDLQ